MRWRRASPNRQSHIRNDGIILVNQPVLFLERRRRPACSSSKSAVEQALLSACFLPPPFKTLAESLGAAMLLPLPILDSYSIDLLLHLYHITYVNFLCCSPSRSTYTNPS